MKLVCDIPPEYLQDCAFPDPADAKTNQDLLNLYKDALVEIERCSGDKRDIRYYLQELLQ